VIHSHIDWLPLPLLGRLGVPFLTTMHNRLDLPGLPEVARTFPQAPFVSISDNQRLPLSDAKWLGTIYHGLPWKQIRPCYENGSHLAFLGRLTAEKGPDVAIRIARAAGIPLHVAAKIPRAETGYFKRSIEPHIKGACREFHESQQLLAAMNPGQRFDRVAIRSLSWTSGSRRACQGGPGRGRQGQADRQAVR
jgi:hypothetical protein